ncbi:hypothetical protein F5Y19DRAFT_489095 [Xylariaceae sp. FL1651]|nr:hypothetical protein F5Y19DRAFT_489095 [Xylariaceae sp. FL1651]
MVGDLMDTPPDTPGSGIDVPPKGDGPFTGGNVNNAGVNNQGGIVAGNICGYNFMIGTINVAVASATDLGNNIQNLIVSVEIATQKLRSIEDKVGATKNVLSTISDLIVIQAKREGIVIVDPKEMNLSSGKEDEERNKEEGEGGDELGEHESDVLKMKCFRNLIEASKGTARLFQSISQKIRDASDAITSPQLPNRGGQSPSIPVQQQQKAGRPKVELSESDKERVFLAERDIEYMETSIESHKTELYISFTVFQYALKNEKYERKEKKREEIEKIIVDSWRWMKSLADRLLRDGGELPPNVETQHPPRPYIHDPPPLPRPRPLLDMRPLSFPDLSRLTSLYMGWIFRKALPPNNLALRAFEHSQKPSWAFAVPVRMPFSTEELFLRVLTQVTRRANLGRSLQDDCAALLNSTSRRMLVNRLIEVQNVNLQISHPQLEWTLAGLGFESSHTATTRANGRKSKGREKFASEEAKDMMTAIEVILKTQWRTPGSAQQPRGPVSIGDPTSSGWLGPDVNFGGLPGGGVSGIPVSPGDPRYLAGARFVPVGGSRGGGNAISGIHDPDERGWGYPEPHSQLHSRPRPQHSETASHRPVMISEPEYVFVKEGGKKKKTNTKGKHKHKEGSRHRRRDVKVYVELRRPGSYYSKRSRSSDGGSPGTLPFPDPPLPNPPSPPPPPPEPVHISVPLQQTASEQEEEETEVVEELFEEWEELIDKKGKKKSKRRNTMPGRGWRSHVSPKMKENDDDSDVGIIRMLMKQVEEKIQRKLMVERKSIKMMKVERMQPRAQRARHRRQADQHARDPHQAYVQDEHGGRQLTPSPPLRRRYIQELHPERVQERRSGQEDRNSEMKDEDEDENKD